MNYSRPTNRHRNRSRPCFTPTVVQVTSHLEVTRKRVVSESGIHRVVLITCPCVRQAEQLIPVPLILALNDVSVSFVRNDSNRKPIDVPMKCRPSYRREVVLTLLYVVPTHVERG